MVHVPKAAGSALRSILRRYKDRALNWHEYLRIVKGIDQRHSCLYFDYVQAKLLTKPLPLKIIVSIRNPYDRIYSAFLFNQRTKHYHRHRLENHPRTIWFKKPFVDFVKEELSRWVTDYRQAAIKKEALEPVGVHFAPISIFLTDNNGKVRSDYFIRQESFADDITQLAKELGWPTTPPVVEHCANGRPPAEYGYLQYYDQEALTIINQLYEDEFLLFGYRILQKLPK